MKVQQFGQFLIMILLIFYLLDVESQCDRYIDIDINNMTSYSMSPILIGHGSKFDNVVAECLPDSYKDYKLLKWFNYHDVEGDILSYKSNSKEFSTSSLFSQCEFSINETYTNICNDDNCVSTQDMSDDYLETHVNNIEYCEYKLNSNISMSIIGYGYYINKCNYNYNSTLYIKYECKCNNLYQLTFYSSDHKCLFKASLFENDTFSSVTDINCSINQCKDNEIIDDNINNKLAEDYECVNECITKSILPTTTKQISSINKIMINKVVLMIIIISLWFNIQ